MRKCVQPRRAEPPFGKNAKSVVDENAKFKSARASARVSARADRRRSLSPLRARHGAGVIWLARSRRGGDAARLRQCLTVLLDNAVKFSSPAQKVTVALARKGASARLSVTDRGEGVAPNELPQVFDRFYQTEAGRRARRNRPGFGDRKADRQAHGGSIEASSAAGGGTRISILLSSAGTAVQ